MYRLDTARSFGFWLRSTGACNTCGALFLLFTFTVDILIPQSYITVNNFLIPKYMSKKMGRPPLPKGKAKGVQVGVRFKPDDDRVIENALSDDEATKADYIREAAISKAKNEAPWVRSKWTREQLADKTVEYRLIGPYFRADGIGKFLVRSRNRRLRLEIDAIIEASLARAVRHRYWLSEECAAMIEPHPNPSKADFRLVM